MSFIVHNILQLQPVASTAKPLLDAVKKNRKGHDPMQSASHLTSFVINTLFNALVNSILQPQDKLEKDKHDKLAIWFEAYR